MMYDVKGNLKQVLGNLPQGVRLVAISKYHPNEYIEAAYEEGQRIFGESHHDGGGCRLAETAQGD